MKQHAILLAIILLFSVPLILPFLKPGIFPTQDGGWAVVRLAEFNREIKDLQIPPRWSTFLNHGYGYPLFLFTYPFPYYVAEFLHLLGFGLIVSIKTIFIFSIVGSVLAMYLLAENLYSPMIASLVSILYLYAPYRLTNLYVRGSIGESVALIFFPLLFWAIKKIFDTGKGRYVILLSLFLDPFMLTHNATVVLFLPFLAAWIGYLYFTQKKRSNYPLVLTMFGLIVGLLLSIHFWLPAVWEKSFIALSKTPLADKSLHFLSLGEIVGTSSGSGLHPAVSVGVIFVILGLLSMVFLQFSKTKRSGLFFAGLCLISIFFLTSSSHIFWQLPLLKDIDFPWRLLSVVIFLLPLSIASAMTNPLIERFTFILSIGAVVASLTLIKTQPQVLATDDYYATNDATTTSADELMPIWVVRKPTNRPPGISLDSLAYQTSNVVTRSNRISFRLTVLDQEPVAVVVNQVYFPGWNLSVDEHPTKLAPAPVTGLSTFVAEGGEHNVVMEFKDTPIQLTADLLKIAGLAGVAFLWIFSKKTGHL